MSGYTIVSLCQDTQLCLGLVSVCSNIFHFFHCLKLFSFTFYFPSLKFSRCLPQKITSRYTIVWFVWRVHYCVLLLPEVMIFLFFFQSFPLPFPLLKFFSFNYLVTFLVSFIWNSQKCPISQNIWCLIKTQLKTSLKQLFKGVVHEQPWYIIVWFVWRVHYCVQLLSWGDFVFFLQSFPLPFPLLKFFP